MVALLAGLAWFTLQSAAIADAGTFSEALDAAPLVAMHTRYGNMLMMRLGLLLIATVLGVRAARSIDGGTRSTGSVQLSLILTAIALGLQGFIGHAGATSGGIGDSLVLFEALHLLAAGIWLGALLPLWLSLRALSPAQAATVCEHFSPIGLACVLVLAGTGCAQGLELIGDLPGLVGTPYGHIALVKIVLFLLALGLAAANRLWLTDRLTAGAAGARRHLAVSIGIETMIGLTIVTAAAFLAASSPSVHQAPVWPFSWQFSLLIADEDPDVRQKLAFSLITIGIAAAMLAAALVARRFRLLTVVVLATAAIWRGPSLSLLTIEAYPTSFMTSPTEFSAASITRGEALFARNCVACHGAEGEGNGPADTSLRIKPANLTTAHLRSHTDGDMYWWLSHGVDDQGGGLAMPGFAASLSADDRWALIDYVRAHNAGIAMEHGSGDQTSIPAPGFAVACDSLTASTMADLRGYTVHVIVGETAVDEPASPALTNGSAITLLVPSDAAASRKPVSGGCIAADQAAWPAYAVLADLPPSQLAGAEFLVDSGGWLRAERHPDGAATWHVREHLLADLHNIAVHPLEQQRGEPHEHHH
jgi:putative copper export protein/mono/diheme cytochrome c family protein